MSEKCDFGRILNQKCNLHHFSRTSGLQQLDQLLEEDQVEIYLWRAGRLDKRNDVSTICKHHEQFFGNAFERREKYCCQVLTNHTRKTIKGKQIITLEMAKYLKSKNFDVIPGTKLCRQCQKIYNEMDNKDSDNSQQATTDQEFDECETPKKNLKGLLDLFINY